jgi:hypothetical protein
MIICFYFVTQSAFYMNEQQQSLKAIQDIKQMMERSSRFISLSGWSGIAAGLCALAGVFIAKHFINEYITNPAAVTAVFLEDTLLWVAVGTFLAAFVLAFIFTSIRSRRQGITVWGTSAKRLLFNTAVPLLAGAIFVYKMLELRQYALIAPACLIFYGLALINGSKYTLGEVKYLGYCQVILGCINLWIPGNGLYFWAFGFGLLHIIYGGVMWWKYEKK